MSDIRLTLRLVGELPEHDELCDLIRLAIRTYRKVNDNRTIAIFCLTEWMTADTPDEHRLMDEQMLLAADRLRAITPALGTLDSAHVAKELRLSTVRTLDQGGIYLPLPLVQAVSDAELFINISITVVLDYADDDDDDGDDDDGDTQA